MSASTCEHDQATRVVSLQSEGGVVDARDAVPRARLAQARWSDVSLRNRLNWVRRLRHEIAANGATLCSSVHHPARQNAAESLAAEVIPLADACRFLEQNAAKILSDRRFGRRGRPKWLNGVNVRLQYEPLGAVLIVAASNYPIFLAGVQAIQALVAGNAVLLKPGQHGTEAAIELTRLCERAGLPTELIQVLPEDVESVRTTIQRGVDKVILTGSANAGRAVLNELAPTLTPATMELSGCDSMWLLPGCQLSRAADALAFGLDFNSSQTCIAPRRIFVPHTMLQPLKAELARAFHARRITHGPLPGSVVALIQSAINQGACLVDLDVEAKSQSRATAVSPAESNSPVLLENVRPGMQLLQSDVFAPVASLISYGTEDEALAVHNQCPYALGASIFGPEPSARRLAGRLELGCVVINDLIAPTADPRIPFGGRNQSGFGVTRGADGLREMVYVKTVVCRRSRWLPHLQPSEPHDEQILSGYLSFSHGGTWRERMAGLRQLVRAAYQSKKQSVQPPALSVQQESTTPQRRSA